MNYFTAVLLLFSLFASKQAAVCQSTELARKEWAVIFTQSIRSGFGIDYPIYKAFCYVENSRITYILLAENNSKIGPSGDTLSTKIKGAAVQIHSSGNKKLWEINDLLDAGSGESSIWFWTKYCAFEDIDKDRQVEPLIVYGTAGLNGIDDGRIKILLFYKGKKTAIRHQNSVVDSGRATEVDASFYALPQVIQDQVKALMKKLEADKHASFPDHWQDAMNRKKTAIK